MATLALRLRPGYQLASTVCTTRVVTIRVPAEGQPTIECGGSPMIGGTPGGPPSPGGTDAATLIGKRYVDAAESVELLCVSSGTGALACAGLPMSLKAAKPLPASDRAAGLSRLAGRAAWAAVIPVRAPADRKV